MGQDISRIESENSEKSAAGSGHSSRTFQRRSQSTSLRVPGNPGVYRSLSYATNPPPAYSPLDHSESPMIEPFIVSPPSVDIEMQPPPPPVKDLPVASLPHVRRTAGSSTSRRIRASRVTSVPLTSSISSVSSDRQDQPSRLSLVIGTGSGRTSFAQSAHVRASSPSPSPPRACAHAIASIPAPVPARVNPSRGTRVQPENPLMQLVKYDTVIIVDDSSSMAGRLWLEAEEALAEVARLAAQYNTGGIDICFLNSPLTGKGVTPAEVKRLFAQVDPDGITPTGEKLETLLWEYLSKLEQAKAEEDAGRPEAMRQIKPINYLVITDGAPTDDPETVIVTAARRLDKGNFPLHQVGIQFIQIGQDASATEALRELDDDLAEKYGIRDMVDTTPYTGEHLRTHAQMLAKILLGGINRRVDRRGGI